MAAKAKAKAKKPVKKVKKVPRPKAKALKTKCPKCGATVTMTALMAVPREPPKCPSHPTTSCDWNSSLQAWKCPVAGCGKVICSVCWSSGIRNVMVEQTYGRYKCPQCKTWAPPD